MTDLLALAARTTSGAGAAVVSAPYNGAKVTLEVVDVSGTGPPTLTIAIETSRDGGVTWRTVSTFSPVSVEGETVQVVLSLRGHVRVAWTIAGGTPSFTFGVYAEFGQVYATPADFADVGLPARATKGIASAQIARFLWGASRLIDDYIGAAVTLPLLVWAGASIERAASIIAAYDCLSWRGYDAAAAADTNVRDRYLDIIKMLEEWKEDGVVPGLPPPTPGDVDYGEAEVVGEELRGW